MPLHYSERWLRALAPALPSPCASGFFRRGSLSRQIRFNLFPVADHWQKVAAGPRQPGILMANTKSTTVKAERKKLKRAARKKAAPKPKRTVPRGSQKKKVRKMVRGQSKR
jgi:hypothetical protein